MENIYDLIEKYTNETHDYAVKIRRYFHMHPEIAKEEFNTQRKIEEELDKMGLSHKKCAVTGVYTEIKGEKLDGDKTIVLRADIDALPVTELHQCEYKSKVPGKMHACGHDAHAASLLTACKILSEHTDLFSGTVRITFQPGEEIGYGARPIIQEGFLDGADRTFGIHVGSDVPVGSIVCMEGPNNASVDWFKIHVTGHGAHVSTPQMGIDAAYIASNIVVSLQALITRMTSPMDNVLIGVGKINAGNAYNVVAESADIEGTIRVFTPEIRKNTKERLERLASNIAENYGGSANIEWKDFTSPLINDHEATLDAQKIAIKLFGESNVIKQRTPALSGDDFAEYILKVPGVYCYAGTRNEKKYETTVAHHDSMFDIDEDGLKTSVKMYVGYAIEYLNGTIE